MKAVLIVFLVTLAAIGALLARDVHALMRPMRADDPNRAAMTPMTVAGAAFRDVSFPAAPGQMVRGWLVEAPDGGKELIVIAMHGRGGDRRSSLAHLPIWREAGAAALLIDARGAGASDGPTLGNGLGVREAEDVLAAVETAGAFGYKRIVLIGWSLGGAAVILEAARDDRVAGVIAECAMESFPAYASDVAASRFRGLAPSFITKPWGRAVVRLALLQRGEQSITAPVDVIGRIAPRPVLIFQGMRDRITPPRHGRALAAAAGENARFIDLPAAAHCDGVSAEPQRYRETVSAFLNNIAAAPPPPRRR